MKMGVAIACYVKVRFGCVALRASVAAQLRVALRTDTVYMVAR
jgi:hypothetical protein